MGTLVKVCRGKYFPVTLWERSHRSPHTWPLGPFYLANVAEFSMETVNHTTSCVTITCLWFTVLHSGCRVRTRWHPGTGLGRHTNVYRGKQPKLLFFVLVFLCSNHIHILTINSHSLNKKKKKKNSKAVQFWEPVYFFRPHDRQLFTIWESWTQTSKPHNITH